MVNNFPVIKSKNLSTYLSYKKSHGSNYNFWIFLQSLTICVDNCKSAEVNN